MGNVTFIPRSEGLRGRSKGKELRQVGESTSR
jgi:hypothetical protein